MNENSSKMRSYSSASSNDNTFHIIFFQNKAETASSTTIDLIVSTSFLDRTILTRSRADRLLHRDRQRLPVNTVSLDDFVMTSFFFHIFLRFATAILVSHATSENLTIDSPQWKRALDESLSAAARREQTNGKCAVKMKKKKGERERKKKENLVERAYPNGYVCTEILHRSRPARGHSI